MADPDPLGPRPADLSGRLAVVTGAAQGIGRGVVARLVDCGVKVLAVDNDEDALAAACARLGCVGVLADLARANPAALANEVLETHGPVELIVNNVGTSARARFLQLDEADFDRVLHVNLRGPWFFTRRLVLALIDREMRGSVVFVSSLHDTFPALDPSYSATKAAVAMLVRELAYELGPHGIRVNAISPGSIRTTSNPIPVNEDRAIGRLIASGRSGEPDDVAKLVVVLLSDGWSGYVTGVNLPVDGGLALHSWVMDQ